MRRSSHYFSRPGQISVALLLVFAMMFTTFALGIYAAREARSVSLFRGAVDAAAMTAGADLAKGATVMGCLTILRVLAFGAASIAMFVGILTLNVATGTRIWTKVRELSRGMRMVTRYVPLVYTIKAMVDARTVFETNYPSDANASAADYGLVVLPTKSINELLRGVDKANLGVLLEGLLTGTAEFDYLSEYLRGGVTVLAWRKRSVFDANSVVSPASPSPMDWLRTHEAALSACEVYKTMPGGVGLDLTDEGKIDKFLSNKWDGDGTEDPPKPAPTKYSKKVEAIIGELGTLQDRLTSAMIAAGHESLSIQQDVGTYISDVDAYVNSDEGAGHKDDWELGVIRGDKKQLQDAISGAVPVGVRGGTWRDVDAMVYKVNNDLKLLGALFQVVQSAESDPPSTSDATKNAMDFLKSAEWQFLNGDQSLYSGSSTEARALDQYKDSLNRIKDVIYPNWSSLVTPPVDLSKLLVLPLTTKALGNVTTQRKRCQQMFADLQEEVEAQGEEDARTAQSWLTRLFNPEDTKDLAKALTGIPGGNILGFLIDGTYKPVTEDGILTEAETVVLNNVAAGTPPVPDMVKYVAQAGCSLVTDISLAKSIFDVGTRKDLVAYYAPVLSQPLANWWGKSSETVQLGDFSTTSYVKALATAVGNKWKNYVTSSTGDDLLAVGFDTMVSIAKAIFTAGVSVIGDVILKAVQAVVMTYIVRAVNDWVTNTIVNAIPGLVPEAFAARIDSQLSQIVDKINGILGAKPALIGAVMRADTDGYAQLRPTPCPWWDRRRLESGAVQYVAA